MLRLHYCLENEKNLDQEIGVFYQELFLVTLDGADGQRIN